MYQTDGIQGLVYCYVSAFGYCNHMLHNPHYHVRVALVNWWGTSHCQIQVACG